MCTRWLTLAPASHRLFLEWEPLIEYFMKFNPKKMKTNEFKILSVDFKASEESTDDGRVAVCRGQC